MAQTAPPPFSSDDETSLISAAQRDRVAFTALYDRYYRPIYRYLYSRVYNATEAEDLTSQTFLSALEALPRYRHRGFFSAWLFAIARNRARDHFRHKTPEPLHENAPDQADDPLSQAVHSDEILRLAFLVKGLNDKEQELIRLRCIAELPFAEIGACLGQKEDTVKKAFYRLRARLQERLEVNHDRE